MHAVVMAAGEGRRLRPLTERWPKPILPIDGRPVIATLLRELANARIQTVTVVVGHLAEQVEALVGDGSAFALHVRYARQPEALGSADAVRRALDAGAAAPLLVTAADTVYTPGDVDRARTTFEASSAVGALAVREVDAADADGRATVTVEGRRLVAIGGPPQRRGDRVLAAAPLWFARAEVAERIPATPGPPHELAHPYTEAIAAGAEVLAVEVGPTRDVTHPADVVTRNFPYLERER